VALLAAALVAGCGESATDRPGGAAAQALDAAQDVTVRVPDVIGEDVREAQDVLEKMRFLVTLDPPSGPAGCTVGEQDPKAGETVARETEVTILLDCRQVDWERQEGQDWDAYTTGYSTGFVRACKSLFALLPSGVLLEPDSSAEAPLRHDEAECRNEAASVDDPPPDVPDDPERAGKKRGVAAGCQTPFDLASEVALFDGTQEYTAQDCLDAVATAKAAPPASRRRERKQAPESGGSESYRVSRADWNAFSPERKLDAARSFLADNPQDCGAGRLTDGELRDQADEVLSPPGDGEVSVDGVMLAVCRGIVGGG
jgi:hypothetical protein